MFGNVEVLTHEPTLVGDRLPSDKGPGLGLGKLSQVTVRRINSFDLSRESERIGVRHIDAEERRERLLPISRAASIDALEREAEVTRMQRMESLRRDPDADGQPNVASVSEDRTSENSPHLQLQLEPPSHNDDDTAVGLSDLFP